MATGFVPHGNDRVAAMAFEPLRFLDRGGGAQYFGAACFDPRHQRRCGQAEVEADNFRSQLLDEGAGGVVKWRTAGHGSGRIKVGAEFVVVPLEQRLPLLSPLGIGNRRHMAEEVEVQGLVACVTKGCDFAANRRQIQGGTGQ